jgi:hypothetical protein
MYVADFFGEHDVATVECLASLLQVRNDLGCNSYHMGHQYSPSLLILARNDLAWMHFFPAVDHPGFISRGCVPALDPQSVTTFYHGSMTDKEEVNNSEVITYAQAEAAAKEFLLTNHLPTCVEWHELRLRQCE